MRTFVRSAAFVAGLLCVGATTAQDSKTNTAPAPAKLTTSRATTSTGQPIAASQWAPLNVEHMMKDLALNEDQTGKLKQMDAQYNKLHASGQAGVTDADLMRRRDAEVQAILTPDQYAKWGKQHTAAAPAQQAKPATMATPAQPASKPAPATPAQPATKPAPKPASK